MSNNGVVVVQRLPPWFIVFLDLLEHVIVFCVCVHVKADFT
jgi:hypothetical protein